MKVTNEKIITAATTVLALAAMLTTGFTAQATYAKYKKTPSLPQYLVIDDWKKYANGNHRQGPVNAPVTVVFFSDYQCPACKDAMPLLQEIQRKHGDQVSIVLRHFPVPGHEYAKRAAIAAICAESQGAFRALNTALFASAETKSSTDFVQLARDAGIEDDKEFSVCLQSEEALKVLANDLKAASELGVMGTPTVLVNNKQYIGVRALERVIREELQIAE